MYKKLKLLIKMLLDERLISTCYFIILFAITFVLNITLSDIERARYCSDLLCHYNGSITVLTILQEDHNLDFDERWKQEQKRATILREKLINDKRAWEVGYGFSSTTRITNTFNEMTLYQYNQSLLHHINYRLCKGKWFQNKDEMVMGYSAMRQYKLGDSISLTLNNGDVKEMEIVGFLVNDYVVSNEACASKHDTTEGYWYNSLVLDTKQHVVFSGTYSGIVSPDFPSDSFRPMSTLYITGKKDVNPKDLTYFNKEYGDNAEFYDFSKPFNEFKDEYMNIKNRDDVFLIIALLILFCTGFCVNNSLRIQKKMNEYAIYYICGVTWRESVLLCYLKNAILFFTTIPFATLMSYLDIQRSDNSGLIFTKLNAFAIFMGLIFLYVVFSLPVYLHYKKYDPIILQRKDI